jgi:integrase
VTPHTFRKTLATIIDREADAKSAAAQLGHSSEATTKGYYIVRSAMAPDLTGGLIERNLSPQRNDEPSP